MGIVVPYTAAVETKYEASVDQEIATTDVVVHYCQR